MILSRYYVDVDEDAKDGAIRPAREERDAAIHPASCGPSLDLRGFRPGDVRALLPTLKLLLPHKGKSRVAVYVSPQLFADTAFVDELESELPHCAIFDRSQDIIEMP